MFKEQAIRLLREKWGSVSMLAEELYAILSTESELIHEGGITLQADETDEPAAKVRGFSDDAIILRITRRNGDFFDFTLDDVIDALDSEPASNVTVVSGTIVEKIDNNHYEVSVGALVSYEALLIPELPEDEEIDAGTEVALTLITSEGVTTATFTVPVWL